jgi:predicted Holliday junction resolvase-like endonuclease
MGSSSVGGAIFVLIIVVLIFLVLRELVMWYWKINKIVDLLENIESGINALVADKNRKDGEAEHSSVPETKVIGKKLEADITKKADDTKK